MSLATLPTHVARDPAGRDWVAVDPERAVACEQDGWEVVRVVPAAQGNHPTRVAILDHLLDVHEASAKDLAARLDGTLSTISYHVRALARTGEIVPTRTEQRHGALARYYRRADMDELRVAS